jgi:phosphoglycerate dehydrogenase-like enzyme
VNSRGSIARTRRSGGGKLHVHFENVSFLGEVFEVTKERIATALARHPRLVGKLKLTIGLDGDIFDKEIRTAEVLFAWEFNREGLRERAANLRWVHIHGAGVNHVMPLDWLPPSAVITNSRGVHAEKADEYVIMSILMLNNRMPQMLANQHRGRWEQIYSTAISGKTLLIIGVGNIGGGAAKWAKRFGLRVLGIRRSGRPHRFVDAMYRPNQLRKLVPKADFVLITAPHTDDTDHLIGTRELELMKRGAGLVNYSRAHLVDYEALRKKLDAGELSAVLDVFNPEPLPSSSPLWRTPNLIITPHCGSDDAAQYTPRTLGLVFQNMERFLDGRPLRNRVRPELQY